MKKHILTLLIMLAAFASAPTGTKAADLSRWDYYLSYYNATQTVAAGNMVFTLFNGNLLAYDAESNQSYTLDKLSPQLSDKNIANMGWSYSQKCLVLHYKNNNIDLLYPEKGYGQDGRFRVVNVRQIVDFGEEEVKITRMSVYGDWACLITAKGIIVFDVKGQTVRGYYKIGQTVKDAIVVNNKVYASVDQHVLMGKFTDDLYLPSSWQVAIPWVIVPQFVGTDNGNIYMAMEYFTSADGRTLQGIARMVFDNEGNASAHLITSVAAPFKGNANGKLVQFAVQNAIVAINTDQPDEVQYKLSAPSTYSSITRTQQGLIMIPQGNNGLNVYSPSTASTELGTPIETVGKFGPRHNSSYSLLINNDRLFMGGSIFSGNYVEGFFGCYNGKEWSDMDEDNAQLSTSDEGRIFVRYTNTSHMAVDPFDPNHVFMASGMEGLYEYQDYKFINLYNCENSILTYPAKQGVSYETRNSNIRMGGCQFDAEGNLWMVNNFADHMLVVKKRNNEWTTVPFKALDLMVCGERILFDSRGWAWVTCREWTAGQGSGLGVLDYAGTIDNTADDRNAFFKKANNEDGTKCDLLGVKTIAEDKNGHIWLGCESGIYEITDPETCFSQNFFVNQPKVPRNDGTDYADYLLTGTTVSAIAVDAGNRKWLGTFGAGLYLVNEDGSEILEHFQMDNSPLLSNNIYDLAIDPKNGRMYIATDQGLCSYNTGTTETLPSLSKSNLRIYPNPIRPEYTGQLTVSGLTQGAEVKVLSTGGQLVARGTATGGSWQWDLTQQASGQRVAPGVYYIMVATADGKKAAAGKVVII